jgi:hypothetical protein
MPNDHAGRIQVVAKWCYFTQVCRSNPCNQRPKSHTGMAKDEGFLCNPAEVLNYHFA